MASLGVRLLTFVCIAGILGVVVSATPETTQVLEQGLDAAKVPIWAACSANSSKVLLFNRAAFRF